MRKITLIIAMLISKISFGQSYDEQMNKAGQELQKKDFCNALEIFKSAFVDSTKIGTYDLAYGAVAAINCKSEKLALNWLNKSQKKGLGSNQGELDFILADTSFAKLYSYPEWIKLISDMKNAVIQKEELQKIRVNDWESKIKLNSINITKNKKFAKPNTGFALYYSNVDNLKVPYLVYVPKNYNPLKPTQTIIYLHGGIINTEYFDFKNPDIEEGEPIFSIGKTYNSIIIYPFGKKDFGWVNQLKAFENVLTIIKKVQKTYNIDKKRIFIGGMSNGGTATFWFASKKENIFKGFYAFAAMPKLKIEPINFKNISKGKPFYSINSKEDDVFKYDEVFKIYNDQKVVAKDWNFETLDKGGHGFIYDQNNGKEIMNNLFKKLLSN